jgi:hypothetical protein
MYVYSFAGFFGFIFLVPACGSLRYVRFAEIRHTLPWCEIIVFVAVILKVRTCY